MNAGAGFGWSIRAISEGRRPGDDVRAEHSSVPAIDGVEVSDLSVGQLGLGGDRREALRVGRREPSPVGPAGAEMQWFDFLDAGMPRRGAAVYARSGDTLHWVVVDAPADAADQELLQIAESWLEAQSSLTLSALELRVLADALELRQVGYLGAPWYAELPLERRTELAAELMPGLIRRGIVASSGERLLEPRAERLIRAVLDGDQVLVASRRRAQDETTIVAAANEDEWVLLRADPDGMLRLSTAAGEPALRLAAALGLDGDDRIAAMPIDGHPTSEQPVSELRSRYAASAGGTDTLISLQAVRRSGEGLEMADHAWLIDPDGRAWRIDIDALRGMARLTPVASAALIAAIRECTTRYTPAESSRGEEVVV